MTISTFFATPFYRSNEEDGVLAADITRCCLDMQTPEFEKPDPPQGRIPGVFESNFNFLDSDQSRINDLRSLIQKHLVSFLAVINDSSPEKIAELPMAYHSWFHVTTKGVIFGPTLIPSPHGAWCIARAEEMMLRSIPIIWETSSFTILGQMHPCFSIRPIEPCAESCLLIRSRSPHAQETY